MKDALIYILTSIVDSPDEISVEESKDDEIVNFVISVAPTDMGKVIGKEGKVIRSIRNIMKIKAMKENVRINITLAEKPQE